MMRRVFDRNELDVYTRLKSIGLEPSAELRQRVEGRPIPSMRRKVPPTTIEDEEKVIIRNIIVIIPPPAAGSSK